MEVFSVALGVLALAQTARKVTVTFHDLIEQFKDVPAGINNLFSEHKLMSNCVQRFQRLIEQPEHPDPEIQIQAKAVVRDTQKTLEELHSNILGLIPTKISKGKRSLLTIRCKYMWHEKPLQATLLRLQARREAIALLLSLWSSVDTARVRTDLAGIRKTLEVTLCRIREGEKERSSIDTPSLPPTPSAESSSTAADSRSVSGSTLNNTDDISVPDTNEPSPPLTPPPRVSDLRAMFEKGHKKGKLAGPDGQQIGPLTRRLNAERVADAHRPKQQDGLSPLIRDLSSKEAGAPGLSSEESAAAAHALGKAYERLEDYDNALVYLHESLAAKEFIIGPNAASTLSTVESIAGILQLQSQWNGSLEYYLLLKSRRQQDPRMDDKHPVILDANLNIARMHGKLGDHEIALDALRNLLSVYRAKPNGGSTKAIQIRSEVAAIQSKMGDYDAALVEFESIADDWRRLLVAREESPVFGASHPITNEARKALCEAKRVVVETRALRQRSAGTTSTATEQPAPVQSQSGLSIASSGVAGSDITTDDLSMSEQTSSIPSASTDEADITKYKRALEEAQRAHGKIHPVTLDHISSLAFAYASHGQHDTAIGWYREAIRGWEKIHGPDDSHTLAAVKSMAQCYFAKGNYGTALQHFDRVLRGREDRLEPDHPDTLDTIQEMGSVYAALKEFGPAISSLKKAEAGFLAKYGPRHEDTLQTQFDLADVYGEKGQLSESLRIHEHVLTTRRSCLGERHQWTLTSKHAVAVMCEKLGQVDRAISLLNEAVDGREKLIGKHHSATQNSVLQLANLYWDNRHYENALKYYTWALECIQQRSPDKPSAGVVTMSNIAGCFHVLNRHAEALEWYRKAHQILEATKGPEDPKTIKALQNVAESCKDNEAWAEAVDLLTQALELTQRLLPQKAQSVRSMLFNLAWCTFQLNQFEASLTWSQRLCDTADVPVENLLITRRRVGVILTNQDRLEEAIQTFIDVLEQASAHLTPEHWLISRAMEGLEDAYSRLAKRRVVMGNLQYQRELITARLDSNKPSSISLLAALADLHLEQNLNHEAVPMYESALNAIQEIANARNPDLDAATLRELGIVRRNVLVALSSAHDALGNYTAAILCLEQRAEGEHGAGIRLDALSQIALLHKKNGHYQQSLTAYLQLLGEQLELGPGLEIQSNKTRRLVGTLYKQLGDSNEALRWYETALDGFRALSGGGKGKGKLSAGLARSEEQSEKAMVEVLITTSLMSTLFSALGRLDDALEYRVRAAEGFERELGPNADATLSAALALANMYKGRERNGEADVWYRKALRGYEAKLEEAGGDGDAVRHQIAQLRREWENGGGNGGD